MKAYQAEQAYWDKAHQEYRNRHVSDLTQGFRPKGGKIADFCVIEKENAHHFFYIERRLTEECCAYPGQECYFGHAETQNFIDWTVHDPVMFVKENSWEEAHTFAPNIIEWNGQYLMAYTGLNRHNCNNMGLAISHDLFTWIPFHTNPLSLCKNNSWAYWYEDRSSSFRDAHLFYHNDRLFMSYTAITTEGIACIALTSTTDLLNWEDHGPICKGRESGYGVSPGTNGPLESSYLFHKNNQWHLLLEARCAEAPARNWIISSPDLFHFDFDSRTEFWNGAYTCEIVKTIENRSLLATARTIRFATVDWSLPTPKAHSITHPDQLTEWQ